MISPKRSFSAPCCQTVCVNLRAAQDRAAILLICAPLFTLPDVFGLPSQTAFVVGKCSPCSVFTRSQDQLPDFSCFSSFPFTFLNSRRIKYLCTQIGSEVRSTGVNMWSSWVVQKCLRRVVSKWSTKKSPTNASKHVVTQDCQSKVSFFRNQCHYRNNVEQKNQNKKETCFSQAKLRLEEKKTSGKTPFTKQRGCCVPPLPLPFTQNRARTGSGDACRRVSSVGGGGGALASFGGVMIAFAP